MRKRQAHETAQETTRETIHETIHETTQETSAMMKNGYVHMHGGVTMNDYVTVQCDAATHRNENVHGHVTANGYVIVHGHVANGR